MGKKENTFSHSKPNRQGKDGQKKRVPTFLAPKGIKKDPLPGGETKPAVRSRAREK